MAKRGNHKSDSNTPKTQVDKTILIDLLEQRIKAIRAVEQRTVVQDTKPDTNDLKVRINRMVQTHIDSTIKELELFIKTIKEL